jgi:hypothetical protein
MWDYLETSFWFALVLTIAWLWMHATYAASRPLRYLALRIVSIFPQRYHSTLTKIVENLGLLYVWTIIPAPVWLGVYYGFTSGSGGEYNFGVPYMFQ